jgi:sugar phosphate isomerase/epimerase
MSPWQSSRRGFLAAAAAQAATPLAAADVRRRGIPLGFDNFAVRAMKWNARQLIDHAEKLRCDSLFITDFGPFEGRLDDASLGEIRRYGEDRGIAIALGSWSICPSSKTFKHDWGCAEEHLALGIRMAKALGSKAFRVILGNHADRFSDGGIRARIADTVEVLKAQRGRAIDSGVKIAMENHAGDMQSRELKALVEAAGPDFVGVNFDSGNACWSLEDPLSALATLAPHVLTTSLRDTMLWDSADGMTTQWTARLLRSLREVLPGGDGAHRNDLGVFTFLPDLRSKLLAGVSRRPCRRPGRPARTGEKRPADRAIRAACGRRPAEGRAGVSGRRTRAQHPPLPQRAGVRAATAGSLSNMG